MKTFFDLITCPPPLLHSKLATHHLLWPTIKLATELYIVNIEEFRTPAPPPASQNYTLLGPIII